MEDLPKIILYSSFAGGAVLLGGLLGYFFEKYFRKGIVKAEINHTAIAFGGGILLAAVSLVLVPFGMDHLAVIPMALLFITGAISFYFIDSYLQKRGGAIAQLMAMLLDFVPESMALGAVFATNEALGRLLAIFIGIQNFPEAFNAYTDLRESGMTRKKCLLILTALSFPGVIGALLGYYFLRGNPTATASLMTFASGGIIYLLFQDIAPLSKMKRTWGPALGGSMGFLVGMIGSKIMG